MKRVPMTCAILVLAAGPALCDERSAGFCEMAPVPGAMMTPAGPVAPSDTAQGPRAALERLGTPEGPVSTPVAARMRLRIMNFTCRGAAV